MIIEFKNICRIDRDAEDGPAFKADLFADGDLIAKVRSASDDSPNVYDFPDGRSINDLERVEIWLACQKWVVNIWREIDLIVDVELLSLMAAASGEANWVAPADKTFDLSSWIGQPKLNGGRSI